MSNKFATLAHSLPGQFFPTPGRTWSCAYQGVLGVKLLNDVRQIQPRLTAVVMPTKFGTKYAITRLVWEISPRF